MTFDFGRTFDIALNSSGGTAFGMALNSRQLPNLSSQSLSDKHGAL